MKNFYEEITPRVKFPMTPSNDPLLSRVPILPVSVYAMVQLIPSIAVSMILIMLSKNKTPFPPLSSPYALEI